MVYRPFRSQTDTSIPVLNPNGQILRAFTHRGRRYTDAAHNRGDSQVTYFPRRPSASTLPVHGQIQSIFLHHRYFPPGELRSQVFVALQAHPVLNAADASFDPYRIYPGLDAQLVHAELDATVEVVPIENIASHFVACPYQPHGDTIPAGDGQRSFASSSYLVVLALDEVSP